MRHRRVSRRLSRGTSHRKAMMRNMVTSLFEHERIETTWAKAREVKSVADKMITLAKRGDLHARRQAEGYIRSHQVCSKLFEQAQNRFQDRGSGYVRVLPSRVRRGDAAPMAIVELVSPAPEGK